MHHWFLKATQQCFKQQYNSISMVVNLVGLKYYYSIWRLGRGKAITLYFLNKNNIQSEREKKTIPNRIQSLDTAHTSHEYTKSFSDSNNAPRAELTWPFNPWQILPNPVWSKDAHSLVHGSWPWKSYSTPSPLLLATTFWL